MNLHLKNFFAITVTTFIAIQASAVEKKEVTRMPQSPIQWVHYLSKVEKGEIAARLAEDEYRRRKVNGTLYDQTQQQKVSFPASFIPVNPVPDAYESAAALTPAGNVTCDINVQNPHAGSGPGGSTVVKAKSSGSCDYIHTGPGAPPPTIQWDLTQVLFRVTGGVPIGIDVHTAMHSRNTLNAVWSASSTQVFHASCINDNYSHFDYVYVTPSPGWIYTGPQPITIPNPAVASVSNC